MKNLVLVILVAIIATACGSASQKSESAQSDEIPANLVELKLEVKGMTCSGCENSVVRSLARLDGVYESEAMHKEECVAITYDPGKTNPEQITEAITRVGFNVTGEIERN